MSLLPGMAVQAEDILMGEPRPVLPSASSALKCEAVSCPQDSPAPSSQLLEAS